MKNALLLVVLLSSFAVHATVHAASGILRIPVLDQETKTLLADHNAKMVKAGFRAVPKTFDLHTATYRANTKAYETLAATVDKYAAQSGETVTLLQYAAYPSEYQEAKRGGLKICYSGDPVAVSKMLANLGDGILTDQLNVIANSVFVSKKTGKKAILFKNTSNDSGDDVTTSYIDVCP